MNLFRILTSSARKRFATEVGRGARLLGTVWIPGNGTIRIGARALIDGRRTPVELRAARGALVEIGEETTLAPGTSIDAVERISIGARVRFGELCKVLDNAHHDVGDARGSRPDSIPVIVEDDAVIGDRAILLPGAFIGRGATVLPGTVVTRRVPAGYVASGVPAIVRAK